MNTSDTAGLVSGDEELLVSVVKLEPCERFATLTVERLTAITAEYGIERATAMLYDRACCAPHIAAFKKVVAATIEPSTFLADIIGIVPGAFHGQHKHTGADGIRIAGMIEGLAPKIEVIPVRSFGSLEENAAIIIDWLMARRGSHIVLTSLSKGGADMKRALASSKAAEAFASVSAWISFSGIVQGTPLITWLRSRPLRSAAFGILLRLQGNRSAVLDELARSPEGPLSLWPKLPTRLKLVHVNACPLERHLRHRWAPRGYARLAPLGPNDAGGILLGDWSRLPGTVYPIWGADHYLQPSWEVNRLLRSIVIAAISAGIPRQAHQSASAPSTPPATRSIA